ncbi:MAG TPA: hypothetical protein VGD99_25315 [Anaerolineae bacterium]
MKRWVLSITGLCWLLTVDSHAQPSFREAMLTEAGMNFTEVFLANILAKRGVPTALRNATVAAAGTSLLHQTAWRMVVNPKYSLPAQMLFVKGDDIKVKMLQGQWMTPGELLFQWRVRYLFLEINPLSQKVLFKPGLLATPVSLFAQSLFSDRIPKINVGQSLKTGTFFYGDYRAWHSRQLIWGGQVIYGQ